MPYVFLRPTISLIAFLLKHAMKRKDGNNTTFWIHLGKNITELNNYIHNNIFKHNSKDYKKQVYIIVAFESRIFRKRVCLGVTWI